VKAQSDVVTEAEPLVVARDAALRTARRFVDPESAEDIAQETALRADSRLEEIASYVGPWAVRVATNLSLDLLRQQRRLAFVDLPEGLAQGAESELRIDLMRAITSLPERQRQVVALRLVSDLDERSTAELLGISPGSVKRHLHRALGALRASPHLTPPLLQPAGPKETPMPAWTDDFTVAVEPAEGWQGRPWDHWQLESNPFRVSRVAVIDGVPVLDADGDEVMEGPGFDFQVVKCLPGPVHDTPLPELMPVTDLPGLLGELLLVAREESDRFSHIWVGQEHLALAVAARGAEGLPDFDAVEDAIARQYDGPLAPARLERVRRRRAGEAFLADPCPKVFTWPVMQLIERLNGTDPTLQQISALLRWP
jgi:RNA polymerase sigma-70 factor (ECF subfamily)